MNFYNVLYIVLYTQHRAYIRMRNIIINPHSPIHKLSNPATTRSQPPLSFRTNSPRMLHSYSTHSPLIIYHIFSTHSVLILNHSLSTTPGGGGVLTYMFSIGMCRGKDPFFYLTRT